MNSKGADQTAHDDDMHSLIRAFVVHLLYLIDFSHGQALIVYSN